MFIHRNKQYHDYHVSQRLRECNPTTSWPNGSLTNIERLLKENHGIIVSDFTAHQPLWHLYLRTDARGAKLVDQISEYYFGVVSGQTPTRIATSSLPEIHTDFLPATSWCIIALGSDQVPIIIELHGQISNMQVSNRTFVNLAKANWAGFTNHLLLHKLPTYK